MDNIPDWDQLLTSPNGTGQPGQSAISARLAGEEVATTGSIAPLLTEFGTTAACTRELDAKAHEDVTDYVLMKKVRDTIKMYNLLDRSIANAGGHFSRLGLMRIGEVIMEENEQATRQFARRGSGTTTETVTVQATRQDGRYQ